MWKWLGGVLLALLVVGGAVLFAIGMDWLGRGEVDGEMATAPRPPEIVTARISSQAATFASVGAEPAKQVLFGDFHVHTTFSFDAFLINLPMAGAPARARPQTPATSRAIARPLISGRSTTMPRT